MTLVLQRIRLDCHAFLAALESAGKFPAGKVPSIPKDSSFSIIQAQQAITSFDRIAPFLTSKGKQTALPMLEERKRKIVISIGYFELTKVKYDRQVFAAMGGAVVALGIIPAKVTPIIRSLTTSIKVCFSNLDLQNARLTMKQTEDDADLQARSARSIALFIDICSSPTSTLRTNPSDKIVKNLCAFLCQDVSQTPIFSVAKSLSSELLTLEYQPARGLATKETKESNIVSEEVLATRLVYHGAQLALEELSRKFGATLLESVPKLWSCMSESILTTFASGSFRFSHRCK